MTDAVSNAVGPIVDSDESVSKRPIPESVRQRSLNRTAGAPVSGGGPSPGRILAAAGSVSLGIGLVAVLAGTGQNDVVIDVDPTPVIVQPAPGVAEVSRSGAAMPSSDPREVIVITGAIPADPAADPTPVARSEGS